jgi:RNA polymerase sigma factor (sigma-70 family)
MENILEILGQIRKGDENAVSKLFEIKARLIYNYPKVRNCSRLVDRGEFYYYVWSYLKDGKRLSTFDPERGEFDFWFAKVLGNFLKTLVSQKLKDPVEIPVDENITNELPADEPSPDETIDFERETKLLQTIYGSMNETERAIILIYSIYERELRPAELEFLAQFRGSTLEETALAIRDLLTGELLKEQKRMHEKYDSLSSLFVSLLKHQESIRYLHYKLSIETIHKNTERIQAYEKQLKNFEHTECKKREKYSRLSRIARRDGSLVLLKNKEIAIFLGLSIGTVTSAITRLRQKFADELQQRCQ